TRMGKPRAAFKVRATSDSVPPGPTPPSFNGPFAANHPLMLVTPLALVRAQTQSSTDGTPMYSNFLASNSMPLAPRICCKTNRPFGLRSWHRATLIDRYGGVKKKVRLGKWYSNLG